MNYNSKVPLINSKLLNIWEGSGVWGISVPIYVLCALALNLTLPVNALSDAGDDLLLLTIPAISRCRYTIDQSELTFTASGGDLGVVVTTSGASCAWLTQIPSEASSWLSATTGGTGTGTITVTATANTDSQSRSTNVQVAGLTVAVNQAGAGGSTHTLPDTGQTKCYNNSAEITCPSPGEAFYGQDGNYQGVQPSYRDNNDGTVTDLVTGLVWEKISDGIMRVFSDATSYCQGLSEGSSDWRIPSSKELLTIVDLGMSLPSMNSIFECSGLNNYYNTWSSTTDAAYPSDMRYMNFSYGFDGSLSGAYGSAYSRCVSGGDLTAPVYIDNNDGTVSDQSYGLMWEKVGSSSGMTWKQALELCENAETGGYADWRLPNILELGFLVDNLYNNPAIDPIFIESGNAYWSGTTYSAEAGSAWYIDFDRGYNGTLGKLANENHARCVRGGLMN